MYHWVPDPDGRVLESDAELTPERFEGYDRAADAGLRLAFDHGTVVPTASRRSRPTTEFAQGPLLCSTTASSYRSHVASRHRRPLPVENSGSPHAHSPSTTPVGKEKAVSQSG